jgi:predicted transcriptional regulator
VWATTKGDEPKSTRAHEVMTPELIACFGDQESTEAVWLMQKRQIRHLAVLSRDQHLVGIIPLRDGVLNRRRYASPSRTASWAWRGRGGGYCC